MSFKKWSVLQVCGDFEYIVFQDYRYILHRSSTAALSCLAHVMIIITDSFGSLAKTSSVSYHTTLTNILDFLLHTSTTTSSSGVVSLILVSIAIPFQKTSEYLIQKQS